MNQTTSRPVRCSLPGCNHAAIGVVTRHDFNKDRAICESCSEKHELLVTFPRPDQSVRDLL